MTNALETENLTVTYGSVVAVQEVSITLPEGQLVTILGPNGAGKTSILRALTGLERIRSGRVRLFGAEGAGKPAHWLGGRAKPPGSPRKDPWRDAPRCRIHPRRGWSWPVRRP